MNKQTLCHCADCHALFDESKCGVKTVTWCDEQVGLCKSNVSTCPECGSLEVGDAEMHHVLANLDDVSAHLKQALKAMATAQAEAGTFQMQARLAEGRVAQVERELAAYKRHIAEMEVRP